MPESRQAYRIGSPHPPRRVQPVAASVVEDQVMSVRIVERSLLPQPRLIHKIGGESDALLLQDFHLPVRIVAFEVQRKSLFRIS